MEEEKRQSKKSEVTGFVCICRILYNLSIFITITFFSFKLKEELKSKLVSIMHNKRNRYEVFAQHNKA